MAEEIKYIPYGNDEIDYNEFLTRAANNVQDYVAGRSWSTKRKKDFMDAYADIMSHGITGASVGEDGRWGINYTGTIDMDTKTDRQKEMYGAAAHFIQLLMKSIPIHKKEEEKKEELPEMDYPTFESNFSKAFADKWFNGNTAIRNDWNNFDKRDETTGKRGIDERKKKMIEFLEEYHNNFDESKYSNGTDIKGKIKGALDALRSENPDDDKEAFTRLGMNYDQFFDNGLNDDSGYTLGDRNLTWAEYVKYQLDKKAQDTKDAAAKAKVAQQQAYNNTQFYNRVTNNKMLGQNASALKQKYGNSAALIQTLNSYAQLDIRSLTPDLQSEVQGAYRYLANSPIDALTLRNLQNSSSGLYRGAAPNRFRKINGVDNLIWDSAAGQVIQISNRLQRVANVLNLDLFKGVKTPQDLQLEYLQSKIPGITNAEWKELLAIGADIGSIINPEPFSAAAMGMGAAGLRHAAKNETPGHLWTFWEKVGQGIDYVTGGIGAIPLLGDAIIAGKTIKNAATIAPKITKALRLAARTGAWKDIYDSFDNGGKQTATKILNGEELTVQDWRNIGQLIRGIAGHHSLNVGNRAVKQVAEKSGFQTEASSSVVNRLGKVGEKGRSLGFFGSKVKGETLVPTLKVKKTEKDGTVKYDEIDLTPLLRLDLGKVKPSQMTAEAKRMLGKSMKEGYEVDINTTGWRDKLGLNRSAFRSTTTAATRGNDEFNTWLLNRGYWDRFKYGTDARVRGIRNGLLGALAGLSNVLNSSQLNASSLSNTSTNSSTTNTSTRKLASKLNVSPESRRGARKEYIDTIKKRKYGSKTEADDGTFNFELGNGTKMTFNVAKRADGNYNIRVDSKSGNHSSSTGSGVLAKDVKDYMRHLIELMVKSSHNTTKHKEMGRLLREFKARGWLKQGGLLQYKKDNTIENFLKEYNL